MSNRQECGTKNYCTWWIKKPSRTGYSSCHNQFLCWKNWDPPPGSLTQDLRGSIVTPKTFTASLWEMPWTYYVRWRQLSANASFTVWDKALIPPLFPSHLFISFLFLFWFSSLLVFCIKNDPSFFQPQLHLIEIAKEMFWNSLLLVEEFPNHTETN